MSKTPEELSKEAADRIKLAEAASDAPGGETNGPVSKTPITDKQVAAGLASSGVSAAQLEAIIEGLLQKKQVERTEAKLQQEPDYKTLSEADAYSPAVYIPVIDHDVPDYLNMKLADEEYVTVFANRDQRRLGQLQAEGYEFLRPEHVASNFKVPLKFDAEGNYVYQDVIAMRVHKRILYGKRRKVQDLSRRQLNPKAANLTKRGEVGSPLDEGALGAALAKGSMEFF